MLIPIPITLVWEKTYKKMKQHKFHSLSLTLISRSVSNILEKTSQKLFPPVAVFVTELFGEYLKFLKDGVDNLNKGSEFLIPQVPFTLVSSQKEKTSISPRQLSSTALL